MEPQIQYALTEDGVSIAYWTIGEGVPFILPHGAVVTSSLRAWRTPEGRTLLERLAAHRMIARYDARGFGNSQAGAADFSLEARVRDLTAVVDKLGAERVDLCGYLDSGPGVLAYTAAHPERVAHLILWATSARGLQFVGDEVMNVLVQLADVDFELYSEAMASAVMRALGIDRGAQEYAETLREGMTVGAAKSFLQAQRIDVTNVLGEIRTPTMVLHRRGVKDPPMADVQALAARIPNARLVLIEGDSSAPYVGDIGPIVAAIDEFLSDSITNAPTRSTPGGMVTILLTDLVSSTALTQRLGDAKAQELVRAHNSIVRDALSAHGGTEIKHTGDGIMASFPTASGAIECAIAIQQGVASRDEPDLQVYIGLNAGEPVAEERDLFGTSVQLARRICDHAESGQILVSNVVRELSAGKGFLFADIGEVVPKGFEEPVRLYEVRWQT